MLDKNRRILGAAAVNLISNFLGKGLNYFALSILVAYFFGASWKTDSYVMGGIIPFWIMTVIFYGFNSCLIPVFVYHKEKSGDEDAQKMAVAFYLLSSLGLTVIITLGIVTAPIVIPLYSPGFHEKGIRLAVSLARWMYISLLFNYSANFFASIFYSYHNYIIPAISNIILPAMLIVNLMLFNKTLGIYSLISGLISGLILQGLWLTLRLKLIYRLKKLRGDFRHPGIRKIFSLLFPIAIGASIYPIFIIITRMLASDLGEGYVAIFDFATKIVLGIMFSISAAISVSLLPTLSEEIASIGKNEESRSELNGVISLGVSVLSFFLIPAAFVFISIGTPVVRILLERGAFHLNDSIITAQVLSVLAIIILIEPFNMIFTQLMYALKDTKKLLFTTTLGVTINVSSALILVKPLGVLGLALSFPIGVFVQVLALFFIIKVKIQYNDAKTILLSYGKVLAAAACMAFTTKVILDLMLNSHMAEISKMNLAFSLAGALSLGAAVYLICLKLFKFREIGFVWNMIKGKYRKDMLSSSST